MVGGPMHFFYQKLSILYICLKDVLDMYLKRVILFGILKYYLRME
jgi:hypothetical protein